VELHCEFALEKGKKEESLTTSVGQNEEDCCQTILLEKGDRELLPPEVIPFCNGKG